VPGVIRSNECPGSAPVARSVTITSLFLRLKSFGSLLWPKEPRPAAGLRASEGPGCQLDEVLPSG